MKDKVLHISTYYLPHFGGIEQAAFDIVSGLKNDFEQRVICFNHEQRTSVDEYDGIKMVRIGYWKKIASQALSLSYRNILKKEILEFAPDIIHIHLPNPLIMLYLLSIKLRKTKIVVHWHSDIIRQKNMMAVITPIQKAMLKRANLIFATSADYKIHSEQLEGFKNKTVIVPNMVNDEKLGLTNVNQRNIRNIIAKYEEKKIVFFLGLHREYKGISYLIKAADKINNDAIILIAGQGPLTESLKNEAKDKKNVVFLGRITDDEVKEYLHSSYLFAFPSITKNEAFGIALAEALYCGVPAVSFHIDGSGVNWVNKDGFSGIVVPNRDVCAFAKAINALLENTKLRNELAENAKLWVRDNFSKPVVIDLVKKYYSDLLN